MESGRIQNVTAEKTRNKTGLEDQRTKFEHSFKKEGLGKERRDQPGSGTPQSYNTQIQEERKHEHD